MARVSSESGADLVPAGDTAAPRPGRSPDGAARRFAMALTAGDPVSAAALFATDGRMLTADRTEVSGREAIQGVLTQLVQSQIGLEIRLGRTLRVGEIALSTQYWRRRSPIGQKGDGFDQSTVANVVLGLRGQNWKIVIVSPWG